MINKIVFILSLLITINIYSEILNKNIYNDSEYIEKMIDSKAIANRVKNMVFKDKMNLNDCIYYGIYKNIKLNEIRRDYNLQNIKIDDAKIPLYPNINLSETKIDIDSSPDVKQNERKYSLSYDFDISQVKKNRIRLLRSDKLRIIFSYKKEILDTILNVKLAYFNILLILENIKTYQNSIVQAEDFIKLSKKRKALGLGIELDILLNRANLKEKEYLLYKEKNSYKLALENLKKLLKKDDISDIIIDRKFAKNPKFCLINFNNIVNLAFNNSVDLKLMEINQEYLEINRKLISGQQGGNLSFSSGRTYSGFDGKYNDKNSMHYLIFSKRFGYNNIDASYSKDNRNFTGINKITKTRTVSIDLLKGQSNVVEKRGNSHDRRDLKERIEDFKVNLKYEVKRLLFEIANIEKHLESLEFNKNAYKKNLDKLKKKYQLGMIDINQVKDAEIQYDNVNNQINLEEFRYNINIAYLENLISYINIKI